MKDTYYTYMLYDSLNKNVKETINELLSTFDIKYEIKHNVILFYGDFNEDIVESLQSLSQDLELNLYMFEGFRIRDINDIDKINKLFKKYRFKNYTRISDLLLKLNQDEIKEVKNIIIGKVIQDNYLKEVIYGMFENNLNISKTAISVYMHRNSVANKIDIIKKETGLDIQKFNEASAMYNIIKR